MINKKLGFYTCGTEIFDSKIKACFRSLETKQELKWNFNDEIFSKYDWTIEPTETLDELYDRRSRQLRNQYDYIVLSYSGGADSHNILMSFVRQGLHIDEIVVNNMEKANLKFTDINHNNISSKNAGAEFYLQTMPRLKEIADKIPKTKINIMDLSDHLFDSMNQYNDASWVMDKREGLNPANVTRFNYLYFADLRKQFDKDKRIAMIVGVEKPRTYVKDNIMYAMFADRAANMITIAEHMKDYPNCIVEYFYWSPDAVRIMIKQSHIIKHWLRLNPHMLPHWDSDTMTVNTVRLIHERVLRNIIYTTWDQNWWQADKAVKDWRSEFDQWFEDGYSDTNAFGVWKEGIEFIKNKLEIFTNVEPNGEVDGLKTYRKRYKIGKVLPD
jgi:hypothetical protein